MQTSTHGIRFTYFLSLPLLGCLIACGAPQPTSQDRVLPDAGSYAPPVPRSDAGRQERPDAGSQPSRDTGSQQRPDAGSQPVADAGQERPDSGTSQPDTGNPANQTESDWRQAGGIRAQETDGQFQISGCTMAYRWFRAERQLGTIVLLHGFQRNGTNMYELGNHLASHGFSTLVPTLCHTGIGGADFPRSAEALAELVDDQVDGPRLYVGFSAGSMVGAIAAEDDAETVGLFGLDPVAPQNEDEAPQNWQSDFPVGALVGEGSRCNNENSGWPLYLNWGATGWRLPGASHCQFEGPSDGLCRLLCGAGTGDEGPSTVLRHLVTAFAHATLGQRDEGLSIWQGGGSVMRNWTANGGLIRP